MRVSDLKYLLGFFGVPSIVFVSLFFNGFLVFFGPVVAFVVIPTLEQIIPRSKSHSEPEVSNKTVNKFFDWILYLNAPIQYALLIYYLYLVSYTPLNTMEIVGKTLSMGLACGILGINVAHELGHRSSRLEKALAKSLLLTSLYMHFYIEHNRGHHKNVSTPIDPASSRLNEPLYLFWFRSIIGSYRSAWNLENLRLKRLNKSNISWNNEMVRFTLIQTGLMATVFLFFGLTGLLLFLASAFIGILLLETVNYIEHYGLRRREIGPGLFETVKPIHSWNSEHILGRLMLYELTRHSDHHFKASRKFQHLRYFDESPQLPFGYPASIVLSFMPPLWFTIMNKRIKAFGSSEKLAEQKAI